MNKIKRAIIMASGLGTRLRPLTLTVPKPLLKIGGVVMIESIIDGLLANDIAGDSYRHRIFKRLFRISLPDKYPNADIDLMRTIKNAIISLHCMLPGIFLMKQ